MFTKLPISINIRISPQDLLDIDASIIKTLKREYEHHIINDVYIVQILSIDFLNKYGIINDIDGSVNYPITFTAVVFNPVVGDVLDVLIGVANDESFFGRPNLIPGQSSTMCPKGKSIIQCICPKEFFKKGSKGHKYAVDEITPCKILKVSTETNKMIILCAAT